MIAPGRDDAAVPAWRCVFAGAGGQGVVSAARLLAQAAHRAGLPVAAGQLHGMAQRGGSVVATVVVGGGSTIVADGTADVLASSEPLETLRALPALRPGGLVVTSTRPQIPSSLQVARGGYPAIDDILAALRARAGRVIAFDATALAIEAGSPQVVNAVVLGALCAAGCPIDGGRVTAALEAMRPASRELNLRAFALGAARAAAATPPPRDRTS